MEATILVELNVYGWVWRGSTFKAPIGGPQILFMFGTASCALLPWTRLFPMIPYDKNI